MDDYYKELYNKKETDTIPLHLIQDIYSKSKCAVKTNNCCTNFFTCNKGLRQGCPLSPNLFNLYINDLFSAINKMNPDPLSLGENNYPISALMYADDLILMSISHRGLQICLNELQKYCEQWKLQVNISKRKCMKFYKINKNYDQHFQLDGKKSTM